jgi:hypothetical protein
VALFVSAKADKIAMTSAGSSFSRYATTVQPISLVAPLGTMPLGISSTHG